MKERDKPPVFIKLTPLQVKKIEVMKKSIQEPVTRKDIINGLIESAYVVALNTLYDEGLLSKRTYEDGLKLVPD
jgi:dihydroorotate dehydrogenase